MKEFHLIEKIKRLIPRNLQGMIPIGDDAAVLPGYGKKSFLFTTDVIVEGVDFVVGQARPEAIGRKALAVNLSDIAAMGGRPLAFVVAWGLPRKYAGAYTERAAKGMLRLARRFKVAWVGGDISKSDRLFISIALLGRVEKGRAILRKGARKGDSIYVTGKLGGSIQGKHLNFTPRIREAQFLASQFRPTAMIDISDGFIQDLEHILKASSVGASIELNRIPVSAAAQKNLRAALTDGEDFELLFTLPAAKGKRLEAAWLRKFPRVPLTKVGEITDGRGIHWHTKGKTVKMWFQKKGYVHF